MLSTSAAFDTAVDASTTQATARVRIYREFNAIAPTINVSSVNAPVEERFEVDAVVNIRNPKFNGIAFGPISEGYLSEDPAQAYRALISEDFEDKTRIRYFIPEKTVSPEIATVTVDYTQNYLITSPLLRFMLFPTGRDLRLCGREQ